MAINCCEICESCRQMAKVPAVALTGYGRRPTSSARTGRIRRTPHQATRPGSTAEDRAPPHRRRDAESEPLSYSPDKRRILAHPFQLHRLNLSMLSIRRPLRRHWCSPSVAARLLRGLNESHRRNTESTSVDLSGTVVFDVAFDDAFAEVFEPAA